MMDEYSCPIAIKQEVYCRHYEEVELFKIQCLFEGNDLLKISKHPILNGWVVLYFDICPKRRVNVVTVESFIINNKIDSFHLVFKNALDRVIENPDYNTVARMNVKSAEIDWVSQSASISLVCI